MNRVPYVFFFIVLMAIPFSFSFAQADIKINKKEFKLEKEGFREAWDNVTRGEECYSLGGGMYPEAAEKFRFALLYNAENPELNYMAGVSCLFGNMPDQSLDYFLTALNIKPDVAPDILLLTGLSYQSGGDFSKALEYYKLYSEMLEETGTSDQRVNRYIRECNLAMELVADSAASDLVNLGVAINSEDDDYAPSLTLKNTLLYFTSRRNQGGEGTRNRADMKYDESIYLSTMRNGEWGLSGIAGKNVATPMNEGILYINETNDLMYLYAGWSGNGDIYVSEFTKGKWAKPRPLPGEINSEARETSFCITGNGDERFFTSDRKKGGLGGRDIWYVRRIKKDKWTKPFNLSDLNSPGSEESVWVSRGGDTLWFSSNGHEGIGGYDIFVSFRDSLGSWSEPENLGIPINSTWDDMFFRPVRGDDSRAMITSNRPGGIGGFDIYEIILHHSDTLVSDTLVIENPFKTGVMIPDTLTLPVPSAIVNDALEHLK